jgi:hypothetical protein
VELVQQVVQVAEVLVRQIPMLLVLLAHKILAVALEVADLQVLRQVDQAL